MTKRKNRISIVISFVLAFIALAALIFLTVVIPSLVDSYIDLTGRTEYFTDAERLWVKIIFYAILIPAYVADASLIAILYLAHKGLIFSDTTVYLLRLISLCCFAEVLLFGAMSIFFIMGLVISFAALFLGIVLRVVKNVIEEAVSIKAENDFTV